MDTFYAPSVSVLTGFRLNILARLAWLPLAFSNTWWPIVHIPLCLRSIFDQIYASCISTSNWASRGMFTKRKIFSNVRKIIAVYFGIKRLEQEFAADVYTASRGWLRSNQGTRISLNAHTLVRFTLLFAFLPERNESIPELKRDASKRGSSWFPADWFRLWVVLDVTLCKQLFGTEEDKNISFRNTGNSSFLRIQGENEDDKFDSKFMD